MVLTPPWRLRKPDPTSVARLARRESLPELLLHMLVARGLDEPARVREHLNASPMGLRDPFLLPGMEAGTERLLRAVRDGERILVHGDYDVDGVTGTVLLMKLFRLLGAEAVWHIPNRLVDGYSFGAHSVKRAEEVGASVVISVDNGTSALETITELAERGIDTVVTDHHEPPDGPLPPAVAIVNPKLPNETNPWRELCGGAVAFKLAWGLAQRASGGERGGERVSPALKAFLEEATALVAVATVCDVVPLRDENRIFARYGLRALSSTRSPGLLALLEVAGLAGRPLRADDVAFQIGPRLNASGRLGSAATAVELLLAENEHEAGILAQRLNDLNLERKRIEAEVLAEARVAAGDYASVEEHPMLILAGEGWHQGVVGIVAARLVEELDRPALIIGLEGELGRGSARTVEGFDVLEAMKAGGEHMLRFGGHAQAAGCEVAAASVEGLRSAINTRLRAQETERAATPLLIDYELPLAQMTPELMRQIDRLEPFGAENEAPVLLSSGVRLAAPPREIGRDGSHLVLQVRHGERELRALGFGMAHRRAELEGGSPLHLVYTPRWNTFRGRTTLELELKDFRVGPREGWESEAPA